MIDPTSFVGNTLTSFVSDKMKGALDETLNQQAPPIHNKLDEIIKLLRQVRDGVGGGGETPDIIETYYANSGAYTYNVTDYHGRAHMLIYTGVAANVTIYVQNLPLTGLPARSTAIGWTTLDLPIGSTMTANGLNAFLVVYSNVVRGGWL